MKLLSQKQSKNNAEEQAQRKKDELRDVEATILQKRKELDSLRETRLSQRDSFAKEMEGCFSLLDDLRSEVRLLEEKKRELLKPVDGILDEAYEIHTQARAKAKESETLFESAECKVLEGKQILVSSRKLAESLVQMVNALEEITSLPTRDLIKALATLNTHTKNSLVYTKDVRKASEMIAGDVKTASKVVQKEREQFEVREKEIENEKKHIASQRAAIRAALKK